MKEVQEINGNYLFSSVLTFYSCGVIGSVVITKRYNLSILCK